MKIKGSASPPSPIKETTDRFTIKSFLNNNAINVTGCTATQEFDSSNNVSAILSNRQTSHHLRQPFDNSNMIDEFILS